MATNSKPSWGATDTDLIQKYYESEFPDKIDQLPDFLGPADPLEYALVLDREFPHHDDFELNWIRRKTRISEEDDLDPLQHLGEGEPVFVGEGGSPSWRALLDFIQEPTRHDPKRHHTPSKALISVDGEPSLEPPVTEALYYRLLTHESGWVFVCDIDAVDVAFWRLADDPSEAGKSDTLAEAGIKQEPPRGFDYTWDDIDRALEYAFVLSDYLEDALGATEFYHVYSGQGAHLYVLDDHVRYYTQQSREGVKNRIREGTELKVPIDRVVTQDRGRLMRVPYSLHTDVTRVCQPIDSPDFDYRREAVPEILR